MTTAVATWEHRGPVRADVLIAVAGAATAAVGTTLGLGGIVSGSTTMALSGGAAACAGLLVLMVGGWVDGLALLALSLPLPSLLPVTAPHVPPAAVLTALIVAARAVRRLLEPEPLQLGALPVRAVGFFAAATVVTAVFGIDPVSSAREVLNMGVMLALLLIATDQFSRDPATRRSVALALAAAVGIAGVAALLETFDLMPADFPLENSSFYRATVGFGWPNESGMYFAVGLPLCVYAFQTGTGRVGKALGAASVVGCLVGLMCTFSRASWISVALAPLALAFAGHGKAALRAWVLGAVGIVLLNAALGGAIVARFISLFGDWVVDQRAALQVVGILMYVDHPIVGVGPGGFPMGLEQYGPQVANLWDYVGSAHNGYIEVAAQMGTVGLLSFVGMMGLVLARTLAYAKEKDDDPAGQALRRAAAWGFATTVLVTVTIWPMAHGLGQMLVLVAAMGVARSCGPIAAA